VALIKNHRIITAKLVFTSILPSVVGAFLIGLLSIIIFIILGKEISLQKAESIGGFISSNGGTVFRVEDAAKENLALLSYSSDITRTVITKSNGKILAEYSNLSYSKNWLDRLSPPIHLHYPILDNGEKIGDLHIDSSYYSSSVYIEMFIVATAATWIFSCVIIGYSQLRIIRPLLKLSQTMNKLTSTAYTFKLSQTDVDNGDGDGDGDGIYIFTRFDKVIDDINNRRIEILEIENLLDKYSKDKNDQLKVEKNNKKLWLENMAQILRHELKNSLNALRSTLELISMETQKIQPAHTRKINFDKYFSRAMRGTFYMNDILNNVGNATSFERILDEEKKVRVNLSNVINLWIQDQCDNILYSNVEHTIESNLIIRGNEGKIIQIIENLITNAIDHADKGTAVKLEAYSKDETIVLAVENIGTPLPKTTDEIFNMLASFRKEDNGKHLGIGLYLVKLIVSAYDGDIKVFPLTENGRGARFEITLPIFV
jgi:signal transduction histidine kinase